MRNNRYLPEEVTAGRSKIPKLNVFMRQRVEKYLLSRPVRAVLTTALVLAAIFAPIPFPFKVPTLAAIALVWGWLEHRSLAPLGLAFPFAPRSTLLWAAVGAVTVILVVGKLILPMLEWIFSAGADYSGYGALKGNAEVAFRLWLYAMFSAAIAEEIVYRGFLLNQLSALLPEGPWSRWAAIVLGAGAFAVPHYTQGIVGVISVALVGILFGWIFFRSERNLWSLILAHAVVDTWGLYSLYRGWY